MEPGKRNATYIFNYGFVTALVVLVLNDHVWKWQFPGLVTGKLSDVAGMIILPLLLAFIIPRLKTHSIVISVILFAFWKSPYSSAFINLYNQFAPVKTMRVVDYSDFLAFLILPLPYAIITGKFAPGHLSFSRLRLHPAFLVVPCMLALMATSAPANHYYQQLTTNLELNNLEVKTNCSSNQVLEKLRGMDLTPERYKTVHLPGHGRDTTGSPYYKIARLIINTDTISDLQFALFETDKQAIMHINAVTVNGDPGDKESRKKLTKHYKQVVGNYFENSFKK